MTSRIPADFPSKNALHHIRFFVMLGILIVNTQILCGEFIPFIELQSDRVGASQGV